MDAKLSSGRTGSFLILLPTIMLLLIGLACGGSGASGPARQATPTSAPRLPPTDKQTSPTATLPMRTTPRSMQVDTEVSPYIVAVDANLSAIAGALVAFSALAANPNYGDADWITEAASQLAAIQSAYERLGDLDPPPPMAHVHEAILDAVGDCSAATDHIAAAIDALGVRSAQQTAELLSSCHAKIELATGLLDDYKSFLLVDMDSSSVAPTPTLPAAPSPTVQRQEEIAQVVEVIDGDTIDVVMGGERYRVRYIGIDTPETKDPSRPVEPFGPEASARNAELVGGKTVRLEKDVSETDRYGRLLRYVWVGDLMVNAELVRLGYALVSTYPPDVKYQELFLRLQREAREAGRGMWAEEATPTPSPARAIANTNARLRAGPGTQYQQIGSAPAGTALEIVARNEAGDWYQLASGAWIFGELVSNAPIVPVAAVIPTAAPVVVAPTPAPTQPPAPTEPARPSNCDPSYPTVCIPPPPPDLDCGEIPYRRFPVVGADPHRFDGDHDGIGCER